MSANESLSELVFSVKVLFAGVYLALIGLVFAALFEGGSQVGLLLVLAGLIVGAAGYLDIPDG